MEDYSKMKNRILRVKYNKGIKLFMANRFLIVVILVICYNSVDFKFNVW